MNYFISHHWYCRFLTCTPCPCLPFLKNTWRHLTTTQKYCLFLFQDVIKEQLQETQGLCEYAIYVQGKTYISSLLAREMHTLPRFWKKSKQLTKYLNSSKCSTNLLFNITVFWNRNMIIVLDLTSEMTSSLKKTCYCPSPLF